MNDAPKQSPHTARASAPIHNSKFIILNLCVGLALGPAAAWTAHQFFAPRPATTPPTSTTSDNHKSSIVNHKSPSAALLLPPKLASAEADAALDAYLALPPLAAKAPQSEINARAARLRALLTLLPESAFERLLVALGARTGGAERTLRWIAFDIWLEHDASAAARWAVAVVPSEAINAAARDRYAQKAVLAWADTDFAAAYAWASALSDAKLARSLAGDLLAKLAATDPTRALALAQAGGPEFYQAVQMPLFEAWAKHDPAGALQNLGPAELADGFKSWRLQEAFNQWARQSPAAALDWIAAQPSIDRERTDSLLRQLAWSAASSDGKADPRPLANALLSRPEIGNRLELLSDLLANWTTKSPEAAAAWLATLPDAAQRADLIERANASFGSNNPAQFIPLILQLPPGPSRDQLVGDRLVTWAKRDPDAALAWLRAHDDPAFTGAAARVQGALIGQLATTDPSAALARWQELPAGEARTAAAPAIAEAWAKTDPAAALRWLAPQLPALPDVFGDHAALAALPQDEIIRLQQQLRPYEAQFTAYQNGLQSWFSRDPLATVDWLNNQPAGALSKGSLHGLAHTSTYARGDGTQNAARADAFAQIRDPATRTQTLSIHVGAWLRSDPAAAKAWIDTHDALPAEAAARLLTEAESKK